MLEYYILGRLGLEMRLRIVFKVFVVMTNTLQKHAIIEVGVAVYCDSSIDAVVL
jgi:hypothetical protein